MKASSSRNFDLMNERRTKRDLHENTFGEWRDDTWTSLSNIKLANKTNRYSKLATSDFRDKEMSLIPIDEK